jgi:CHAD domain-containing protein
MNKGEIKNITDNYYRKLKKHSKTVVESFDAEAIHLFRVEYKKLRAFLRMLSQGEDTTGEIRILKKLKRAYNISGVIRDLQLQLQRILESAKKEPKNPQAYLTLLQKEIDKLKPELLNIISENPVAESKKKTDTALPYIFQLQDFKLFIQKKQANINSIIASGHFSDDTIHGIRKNLKDLFYNLESYPGIPHNLSSLNILYEKDEKYFDQLLNELGDFQDKCTAIALLKSNWIDSLNTYNRELLERIKKVWIKEKVNMKQSLIKKLKTDIAPHTKRTANLVSPL